MSGRSVSRVSVAFAALVLSAADGTGQEVGVHGWWISRDATGMRGLLGGGAYVAASPYSFLDVRVGYSAARRTRLDQEQVLCDGYTPERFNCTAEPVQLESRLSSAEVGIVGWLGLGRELRVGAGLSAVRHAVRFEQLGTQTNRAYEPPIERPHAIAAGLSLQVQATPRFSPDAIAFAALSRASAQHGSCDAEPAGPCGKPAINSLRLGVAYRFGNIFGGNRAESEHFTPVRDQ
jgi:hypothetical protein